MGKQTAAQAITKSANAGRTVFVIRPPQDLLTDLLIASTNCRLGNGSHEFWGATNDGKAWRVHTKGNP